MRYAANVEPLRAEEMLAAGDVRTPEEAHRLTLLSTGDERKAEAAFAAFVQERLKKNLPVD